MLSDMLFKKSNSEKQIKYLELYVSVKHAQTIFAPVSKNEAGIYYEQENCFSHEFPMSDLLLGECCLKYWNLFEVKEKNLRELKSTDWPAFKHGKSKAVRSFEFDYIKISVKGANESNLVLLIEGIPYSGSELSVTSSVSACTEPINIGDRINKVIEACITGKLYK